MSTSSNPAEMFGQWQSNADKYWKGLQELGLRFIVNPDRDELLDGLVNLSSLELGTGSKLFRQRLHRVFVRQSDPQRVPKTAPRRSIPLLGGGDHDGPNGSLNLLKS